MATRTRDVAPGKDKRLASSSKLPAAAAGPHRRSPVNPLAPASTSVPSPKHTQKNPRPASPSTPEASKQQGKKPVLDTASKLAAARRRSFEKPPAPSNAQKPPGSPSPMARASSFSGRPMQRQFSVSPTQRSSSFTGRSVKKPAPEMNLKAPSNAGKQHALHNRPVNTAKKPMTVVKKHGVGRSSPTLKEHGRITPREKVGGLRVVLDAETKSQDQESSVDEAAQPSMAVGKSAADELVQEDRETKNVQQAERDNEEAEAETVEFSTTLESKGAEAVAVESPTASEPKDLESTNPESPTVSERQDNDIPIYETFTVSEKQDGGTEEPEDKSNMEDTEEPEDKSNMEDTGSKQYDLEEKTINESDNINKNESVTLNVGNEAHEKEGETTVTSSKEEEAAPGSEVHEPEEMKGKEVVIEKEVEKPGLRAQPAVKQDSVVSNDVIEETASKLQEQRRNRVKALAGAFETVISRQDSKS